MGSLIHSREYLAQHRRTILGRSLAAAIACALPVPILDDLLVSSIRRSMIRRIADARGVDMDEDAIRAIADGCEAPPKWAGLAGGGLALRLASRQWRKLLVVVLAAKRAQAAARSFEIATLFDHYCARLHVGMGLDDASGKRVRQLIDQARDDTEGGISRHLFRRGLLAAAKSSVQAPVEMADLLSGGRITKLLYGESEIEATTEVDEALETQLKAKNSFLARSAAAMELQLAVDQNPYLDNLIDTFDALCANDSSEKSD